MLGKILIIVLLMGIIVIFVINASRTLDELETEPEDFYCIFPDPDDCTSYFNCLGAKIQCPVMERFDTNFMTCRYFFNVNCGTRPNPPDPTSSEICAPFHNGTINGRDRFPLRNCRYFAFCDTERPYLTLTQCPFNDLFNEATKTCEMHVNCGNRCNGPNCAIPL